MASARQGAREADGQDVREGLASIVVPCYCSAASVGGVVGEVERAFADRADWACEIVLVNDGSPDDGATARAISELARRDERVVAVSLARNFGQHAAIMAGFARVRGSVVVCMDDDGQTPADEVFKLIDKVCEGYDLVYAGYGGRKQHGALRNLGSRFNQWCNRRMVGTPAGLEETSYLACKRYVVDSALRYRNPYPYIDGLLQQAVLSCCNVAVTHRARASGSSGYTLRKLVSLWANGFTAFSVLPLRAATGFGVVFALVGFVLTAALVVQRLLVPAVSEGWTSIMAVLLVVGGLVMLMLGVLGEYVGRIYLSINNIPQYVVRDELDRRGRPPEAAPGDAPAAGGRPPEAAPGEAPAAGGRADAGEA